MSNGRVVITGAHGFLGRYAASLYGGRGWHVVGIGHGGWPREEWQEWKLSEWYACDVTIDFLRAHAGNPDVIIHCAGSGSVGFSIAHPFEDYKRTVETTAHVLEYARMYARGARVVFPSSAAVYGSREDRPIREDESLAPVSPYGYHKKMAEEVCESYSRYYGLRISVIRFFSLYGNGLKKQLLWDACTKFAGGGKEVVFSGSGGETRDLLHVRDACSLISCVSGLSGDFDILNGGRGVRLTVKKVLDFVAGEFGGSQTVVFNGEAREGDPKYYQADTTRAESFGWKPEKDWESGIKEYVQWFRKMKRSS